MPDVAGEPLRELADAVQRAAAANPRAVYGAADLDAAIRRIVREELDARLVDNADRVRAAQRAERGT